MENFKITSVEDGKEYWISRPCAVTGIVFVVDKYGIQVLCAQRGLGAIDYQGLWNCPSGYINWDESGEEAASREVFEETGVKIPIGKWKLVSAQMSPLSNKQTIVLRYLAIIPIEEFHVSVSNCNEYSEVAKVDLISFDHISKLQWAFDHDKLIFSALKRK